MGFLLQICEKPWTRALAIKIVAWHTNEKLGNGWVSWEHQNLLTNVYIQKQRLEVHNLLWSTK